MHYYLVLGLFGFADAATLTWTGDGGNSLWSNADNWDLDVIPVLEDVAVIDSNSAYGVIDPVVSVDIDTEIESLSIRPLDVNSTVTLNIDNQSLQIINDDSSDAIIGTGEGTTYLQVTNGGYIGGEDLQRMRFATSPNSVVAYDLVDSQMVCKRFTFESGTSVWNAANSEIYVYPEDTEYDFLNSSATADTTLNWTNCYVLQPNIGNTDFEFGSGDRQVELRAITSGATVDINIVDCDIRWSGRWYIYRPSAWSVKYADTDAWYNSLLWRNGPGTIETNNSRIFTGGYQVFAAKPGGELLGLFENSTFRAGRFDWKDPAQPGYLNFINSSVYIQGEDLDALGEDILAGKFVSNDSNGIIMGPLYKQSYTTTDQTGFTVVAFINDANEPWGFWPHDGRPEEVSIPSKLAWEPGANSASQTVYIGTDNTAVYTGAGDVTVIGLSGDANDTTFETLPNKTYYWRVEAANGIDVWSGPVLEFTSSTGKATNPNPANQSTVEIMIGEAALEWVEGGSWVDTQDVWLGTSEDNMTKITTVAGNVNDLQLNGLIGNLELDATYFWRIDSVDNGNNIPGGYTAEGDTWRFTTANHYLIDDMEAYNSIDNRIYDTWSEGGYAIVALEAGEGAIVNGGDQSMSFEYWGDSYATKSFSSSDFTSSDAKAMVVYFYGLSDNDIDLPYVALSSGSTVEYDGAAADTMAEEWIEWNIDMADFGATLTGIASVTVGMDLDDEGSGGLLYFDDIGIYRSRCIPSKSTLLTDFNIDCSVDALDLEILSNDWLKSGLGDVYSESIDNNNLVVGYSYDGVEDLEVPDGLLDDTSTYTATITEGTNPSSTIQYSTPNPMVNSSGTSALFNNSDWATDAGDTFGIPDTGGLDFSNFSEFTISCFIYPDLAGADETRRICSEYIYAVLYMSTDSEVIGSRINTSSDSSEVKSGTINLDEWHHVSLTWDSAGSGDKLKLYVDGLLVSSAADNSVDTTNSPARFTIGGYERESGSTAQPFAGKIDEFKLYDTAMSYGQIVTLSGQTSVYDAISSEADVVEDNQIDFKDYSKLANDWMQLSYWP